MNGPARRKSHMRITFAMILLIASSCTSTGDDFCKRADSCNFLKTSVDECAKTIDSALDDLPDAYREDAESRLQDCIERPSCSDFASCVYSLQAVEDDGVQSRASDLLDIE
jgi:hypothetical protein